MSKAEELEAKREKATEAGQIVAGEFDEVLLLSCSNPTGRILVTLEGDKE